MAVIGEISLEALLEQSPLLLAYARDRLGDHHEAEEAVQDCLLAAWEQRADFQGRSSLRTWLVGILRHKVLDRIRARRRRPDRPDPRGAASADEEGYDPFAACFDKNGAWTVDPTFAMDALAECPRDRTLREELQGLLRRCLEALPETLRLLFSLREVDHLSTAEAAGLAGVTAASAPVLLTRARFRLRDCLQKRLSSKP